MSPQCSRHLVRTVSTRYWSSVWIPAIPASSDTNSANPIATGARNVAFDFSAARNNTVRSSSAVRNISMNKLERLRDQCCPSQRQATRADTYPWAIDVPPVSLVWNVAGPGYMQDTKAAATIPPSICGKKRRAPRTGGRPPARTRPSVTLG